MTNTYGYTNPAGQDEEVYADGFDVTSEGIVFWANNNSSRPRSRQNVHFVAFSGTFRPNVDLVQKTNRVQLERRKLPDSVLSKIIELRDSAVEVARVFHDSNSSQNSIKLAFKDLGDQIAQTEFVENWADELENDDESLI